MAQAKTLPGQNWLATGPPRSCYLLGDFNASAVHRLSHVDGQVARCRGRCAQAGATNLSARAPMLWIDEILWSRSVDVLASRCREASSSAGRRIRPLVMDFRVVEHERSGVSSDRDGLGV